MSTPAPWRATAPDDVAAGFEPLLELVLSRYNASAPTTLEAITASVAGDETWTPRYTLEATVPRSSFTDALDPRAGWHLDVRAGYRYASDGVAETFPVLSWLIVRELVPIIGTGTARLSAVSAESAPMTTASTQGVIMLAPFSDYVPAMLTDLTWTRLAAFWGTAAGRDFVNYAEALRVNKLDGVPALWWDSFRGACEANGWSAYADAAGRLCARGAPTAYGTVVQDFHDGPGGTVLDYQPGESMDDYANDVFVIYGDDAYGRGAAAGLPGGGPRVSTILERRNLEGVAAADRNRAAATAARALKNFTSSSELRTALTLWVDVWDTVTVQADGVGPTTRVVASFAHRFPSGESTFGLRPV